MKKYVKPEVIIERFELSQNVADCFWEVTLTDGSSCIGDATDQGVIYKLFSGTNSECKVTEDKVEDYCYTVAVTGKVTFQS